MIKEYILQGLSCANCAAKIEASVKVLDGVASATVNAATAKLSMEVADEHAGDITEMVERIVNFHEPQVIVRENAAAERYDIKSDKTAKLKILRLAAGAAILAAGMIFERFSVFNAYAVYTIFVFGYFLLGGEIIIRAIANLRKKNIFDENFLMAIATIGAFIIGEYAEAVAVMLFYQVGVFFQDLAVSKSRRDISSLMDLKPDYANIMIAGEVTAVSPESIDIDDVIVVKPGEKIPLDGVVIEGESMLDASSLTGEPAPRRVSADDEVPSGCVNLNGVLTVKVTRTFGQSTASKILNLVENAAKNKAPVENFITKFARHYTPAVVFFAIMTAAVPPLYFGGVWSEWLGRALIFLVISCPCALVISIPLSYYAGIGRASRKGVLVKGGNYLEALGNLDVVAFDKTGTLTKGKFKVTSILPAGGFSADETLRAAAHAEAFSGHPIAASILRDYGKPIDKSILSGYNETAGRGVSVAAGGKTIVAGSGAMMEMAGIPFAEPECYGTKVYVASDGKYMGCVVLSDELKDDSHAAVEALRDLGVEKIYLLTGDNAANAADIAERLNLDGSYGGLLPMQKIEKVNELGKMMRRGRNLAFVGDGINDAPVLATADVGAAMGGLGSDAAIEAADVVLMTDEPAKLAEAVKVAKFTKRIVWQNIAFALGVKAVFLLLGAMGAAAMWEAVFADVGVALLVVLNSTRIMK